ncbi:O-methyltransferase family 2 [Penicillium cf. griseofulvum]|uniref:O-methyltransferase family 2 n=1 Tax=Penicillium cf. griseofulvum TaxID=2972120 RepID=A0A9W9J3I6_9EURO|nr:O-methyltransferase family 2 [Penicillium cf. griseofulvum]KAJ5434756.1 O-methyltransferase family 2 [Penicillium cf. griseofulvum]KAJ5452587.1 O-methyltransferase family 2 [Penicillium cf. griseofulvum]
MATTVPTESIDQLHHQVTQSLGAFQCQHEEADRVAALKAAQKLVNALQKPQDSVYHLAYSPTHALCVRIAIDMGIFTTLTERNGPVSLKELAAVKNASPILVERVLRVLVAIDYVGECDTRVYIPTTMTRQMTDRLSISVIKFIFDIGMPTLAKIPEFLRQQGLQNPEGILTGPFQFAEKIDESIWTWFQRNPEKLDLCNTFMEGDRGARPSWLEWFPVEDRLLSGAHPDAETLMVDVAGGRGHDLVAFLERYPDVKGHLVLQDLPHVLEESTIDTERIEKQPFDLFKPQPIHGARIYFMKFILHDWSDEDSQTILTQLAGALKQGYSKLIIEEFVLADRDGAMLPAMWDWEMMIFCNSMERSQSHWTRLLESAGFQVIKFWAPPGDGQGIIEAELK